VICDSVQFLESKNNNQSNNQQQRGQAPAQDNPFTNSNNPIDIDDEDLPF
ncbi:TPA: single-stranded DNA-binding protein, partial [Staphylococcus pseudintermedius]|nr:single-stranded DNA-binding protein [Staphylococcus pseudintermedius]